MLNSSNYLGRKCRLKDGKEGIILTITEVGECRELAVIRVPGELKERHVWANTLEIVADVIVQVRE